MKNLLLKLRTLLVVLLIIVGTGIILWIIGTIGGIAKTDSGISGTIAFAILGIGVISIFGYVILRRGKASVSEKNTEKAGMEKENIYNEIKKKHSS